MTVGTTAQGASERLGSFDDFVRARLPNLLRFGRALTGDEHRGADLVQDALERTLPQWGRIESPNPEDYVRRIMVNRNISIWRSLRREHLTDEPPAASFRDSVADLALWAAVRRLPPRQRTVIALRYMADQTEAQTASLMGCSVGAVKSQSFTAMQTLRTLLDVPEEDR
jgi:RNA polymerase sigma-70 factor (sigma-E family)